MSGLPTPAAVPEELLLEGVFMEMRDLAAEAETEMTLDQTGAFIMADAKHGDLLMVLVNTRLLCALMVPPGQRPPLHLVAPGYAVATCLRTMFKAAMRLPEAAVDAAAVAAAGVVSPAELEAALRRAAAHLPGEDAAGLAGRFRAALGDCACYAVLAAAALTRRNVASSPELRSPADELDELAARLYREGAGKPPATVH